MAKKHEEPDHELPDKPRRRPHADHDLPDGPEVNPERIPVLPIIISPGLPEPPDPAVPPEPEPTEVGTVHFEQADGASNGRAHYGVPPALRDRVLIWRHQAHEQNHVNAAGEWVYRATHTSGVGTVRRTTELDPLDKDDA